MGKLIIDGNSVYEVDEECLKKREISPECEVPAKVVKEQKQQEKRSR